MFDAAAAAEMCELISFSGMLKALPREEGGRRYLFIEASNEAVDYQGEIVLARALAESADYYLRYGNLDLDHVTVTGPRRGPADYALYEVGRPVDVKASRTKTMVKGELFTGEGPTATNANLVWDSLTRLNPPQRWYPSVGGAVLAKSQEVAADGSRRTVVTKVRWVNIGLSKTPVNLDVPTVSTVPFGLLAKSWGAEGLDLTKALTMAGGGTDSAAMTGGAALQKQSLDRGVHSYFDYRERMAGAIRKGGIAANPRAMTAHAREQFGLDPHEAGEWTERMLAEIKRRASATTPSKTKETGNA